MNERVTAPTHAEILLTDVAERLDYVAGVLYRRAADARTDRRTHIYAKLGRIAYKLAWRLYPESDPRGVQT